MTTRRQFTRAVALTLGGALFGTGFASADPPSADSVRDSEQATELTVRGSPRLLGVTGLPEAVAPRVEATVSRYRSLSLSDVEFVSAGVRAEGSQIDDVHGTAYGSFDPAAVARELAAQTGFVRVNGQSQSDQRRQRVNRASVSRAERARQQVGSDSEILVRRQPATTIVLDDQRADIVRGTAPEDGPHRIAAIRQQSESAVPNGRGAPELASVLGGDIVAHASLGARARRLVLRELPETAETVGNSVVVKD